MLHRGKFEYDAATAISRGRRERQEDAMAADFLAGAGTGFVVLADGMGGHAAGDVASKIVVTEVFSELKLRNGEPEALERRIGAVLHEAASAANECLGEYASSRPASRGMGATLLAPILFHDRLYWISVGDSPLYLFRNGNLIRLNADHSMAAEFDALVAQGKMAAADAADHPDRHCVTSVLTGADVPKVDCRGIPLQLLEGDILLAASDGLQFLEEAEICRILTAEQQNTSARIGSALMKNLELLDAPEQDNVAICVIKPFEPPALSEQPERPAASMSGSASAASPQRSGRRTVTLFASVSRRGSNTSTRKVTDVSA